MRWFCVLILCLTGCGGETVATNDPATRAEAGLSGACTEATCHGHGTCDDSQGTLACTCDPGYEGGDCTRCGAGLTDYGDGACRPADPCAEADPCAGQHRPCANQRGIAECGACDDGFLENGPGACVPCAGTAGMFRELTLTLEGETRYYFLYVPSAYVCTEAWPALFDLHGTAGVNPEEAYGLEPAMDAADREHFILVRPRSRSSMEGGQEVFRWDQNRGDPARNATFIRALVDHLRGRYHVDDSRLYVMGFSSGTNQVAVLASADDSPFGGYGFVGGGAWSVRALPATDARFYLTTGWRDYMLQHHQSLVRLLDEAGVSAAARLVRETDNGHELYGWMVDEMWPFLDRGERPAPGTLGMGWTAEVAPTVESLLALAPLVDGDLLAAGEGARILRRASASGTWSTVPVSGAPGSPMQPLTSLCLTTGTLGVAVGGGQLVLSHDGGATWAHAGTVPDTSGGAGFPFDYLNGVDCGAGALGAGYWSAAATSDGATWHGVAITYSDWDAAAQIATVRASPHGTWLATGYWNYVARSTDGTHFQQASLLGAVDWVLDAAAIDRSTWVVVGEAGAILRSSDDGRTFTNVHEAPGQDLYAVRFRDASVGLAVGLHGAAFLTGDGGFTWQSVSTGLDRFLGDVAWLADGSAVVVGEGGTVLRYQPGT
jgi:photosystem II stability/assembly factor-like uncharacterized protein/predicted esterase